MGDKTSKNQVTILLGANISRTEKLQPLVISKPCKPQCFANVKSLPLQNEATLHNLKHLDYFRYL